MNSKIRRFVSGLAAVTVLLGMCFTTAAQAADFTVTTTADSEDPGTLRTAINDVIASVDAENRILFKAGLSGAIDLGSDLPSFAGPVEIKGPGSAQLAVDGGDTHSIFFTSGDVTISGLTLRNGYSDILGGAVALAGGTSILDGVRIESNESLVGGGVGMGNGTFTIKDSQIIDNNAPTGGGFYSDSANVTISGTSVSGNTSGFGGGGTIYGAEENTARIVGSRFSDNTADSAGGGLAAMAPSDETSRSTRIEVADSTFVQNTVLKGPFDGGIGGGAILAATTDTAIDSTLFDRNSVAGVGGAVYFSTPMPANKASISNSTFTANSANFAGGAISSVAFGLKVESSTLTGNRTTSPMEPEQAGGGLWVAYVAASVKNSIVSGNTPSDISSSDLAGETPSAISGSFNLIGEMPNANYTETVPGSDITSNEPKLGPLADNGGPTETMLPAETSPVINKGLSDLETDQRGLTRPVKFGSIPLSRAKQANGADIGAVELQTNKFRFGKVKLKKKQGIAILPVIVPSSGKVSMKGGASMKPRSKSARKPATVKLTVRAKGKAMKKLRKGTPVRVKLKVTFSPVGGIAATKSKAIRLVMKKRKKR